MSWEEADWPIPEMLTTPATGGNGPGGSVGGSGMPRFTQSIR